MVRFHDSRSLSLALVAALALGPTGAALAQEPDFSHPTNEPSSSETLMERSDLGNVISQARLIYGDGVRELKRAAKLERKLAESDPAKRADLQTKIQGAYGKAAGKFTEAIRTAPSLLEAYVGLGDALHHLGRHQERLQVHAAALKRDPGDADNFRGWAAAMLELNMLGDATRAYDHFETANPGHAEILLAEMQAWLARRQQDPAGLQLEHIERMADWLAEHG